MGQPSLSLVHLIREPAHRGARRPPLLLLLHGLGSYEGDLFDLAPYLDGRFFIASARAPFTLQAGAYAWFHVQFTPSGPTVDVEEAEDSLRKLVRFIDELVDSYDLDPKQVYLMGFSQGAIMSLSLALTQPGRAAGIVGMSGRIPPEAVPRLAPPAALAGLPILLVHGTEDQVLPLHYGRGARSLLETLPVDLTYREYEMGHEVTLESLTEVGEWLTRRLDAAGHGDA